MVQGKISAFRQFFHEASQCLDQREDRRALQILGVFILVGALLESAIMVLLYPLLGMMTDPSLAEQQWLVLKLSKLLSIPIGPSLVGALGIIVAALYLFKIVYQIVLNFSQSRISYGIMAKIADRLFQAYMQKPYLFFGSVNSGVLIRNIRENVGLFVRHGLLALLSLATEMAVVMAMSLTLLLMTPLAFLCQALVIGPFALGFVMAFRKLVKQASLKQQDSASLVNQVLYQSFSGVKDVKVLGKEEYFEGVFRRDMNQLSKASGLVDWIFRMPRNFLEFAGLLGIVVALATLTLLDYSQTQMLQVVGVSVAMAFRLIPSVSRIMCNVNEIQYAREPLRIISADLSESSSAKPSPSNHAPLPHDWDQLSMKDISFSFEDNKVLDSVNLTVKRGSSIGIVGASGAGKSTLVDILLLLLNPEKGEIRLGETLINASKRDSWLPLIGYVPQKIFLHDASLAENIAFGVPKDEIDWDSLWSAIELAQLSEFVKSLPQGLDAPMGEDGMLLSGGQKQRIGIARALYHNPEILIMDEATSALDNQTEQDFTRAVASMAGQKTIILIAHRLSTIEGCDQIFFLSKGRMEGVGTFETLKNTHEGFRRLAQAHQG